MGNFSRGKLLLRFPDLYLQMPLKIWNVIWNQSSYIFEESFNLQTDFDHLEKKKKIDFEAENYWVTFYQYFQHEAKNQEK